MDLGLAGVHVLITGTLWMYKLNAQGGVLSINSFDLVTGASGGIGLETAELFYSTFQVSLRLFHSDVHGLRQIKGR
jgi:hypothetical protein